MPAALTAHEAVYAACCLSERLFVLNPFLAQQNFYAQQLRALALADEISEEHLRPNNRNVTVIGAGVAGRTVAAALFWHGASVKIFEKSQIDFQLYRNANHRELHPNVIFWPYQRPNSSTMLPFLNWAQGNAPAVAEALVEEWNEYFGKSISIDRRAIIKIEELDDGIQLHDAAGRLEYTDLCVIAAGFEREDGFLGIDSSPYWSPNAVSEANTTIVSGVGDGGLIDALSPVLGVHVTRAAHEIAREYYGSHLAEDIKAAEDRRKANIIPNSKDSHDECVFYRNVVFQPQFQALVEKHKVSSDRKEVTLLFKGTSPFSYSSAPINKLLVSFHMKDPSLSFSAKKGQLIELSGTPHIAIVGEPPLSVHKSLDSKVLVRHGAKPGCAALLSKDQVDHLRFVASQFREAEDVQTYNRSSYTWGTRGKIPRRIRIKGMQNKQRGIRAVRNSIQRILRQLQALYGFQIEIVQIGPKAIETGGEIMVEVPSSGPHGTARRLVFPLEVGPVKVVPGKIRGTRWSE